MAIRRQALCVGINYPGTPSELRGCVNDARDWSAELTTRGYVSTLLLEPTKAMLLSALNDLVANARVRDRLVFTYSGHGTYIPDLSGDETDRRDEALVSSDMRTISDDDIAKVVATVPRGVRLTIISDSCHSGTVTRATDPEARARFIDPSLVTIEYPSRTATSATSGTITPFRAAKAMLLSGCKDDEVSYDARIDGRFRGAMTAAALTALPSAKNMKTWHQGTLANLRYPQTPQLDATLYQRRLAPFA